MMTEEAINHDKIRTEVDKYIAKMKAVGMDGEKSYGVPNTFVELLRFVAAIEQFNYEQRTIEKDEKKGEINNEEND